MVLHRPVELASFPGLGSDACVESAYMPNIDEIVSQVLLLLRNGISLDECGDWMLLYTVKIMRNSEIDNPTRELAYALQSEMTSFGTGQINEDALRQKLRTAIEPFSSPGVEKDVG